MATLDGNSSWATDNNESLPVPATPKLPVSLHRIAEARRQQNVSHRSAARQLGTDIREVRRQERATTDLRLSELYQWQKVLGIPIGELLVDAGSALSRPVLERARMVRLMKTVKAICECAESTSVKRLTENLQHQLTEIMPELAEVSAWHSVGQRRSLSEYGRAAERMISEDSFNSRTDWE